MSKIIQLTPYYEPHLGGVETHVRQLNELLIGQGHEVVVFCQQHERSLPLEEEIAGVRILRIPVFDFQPFLPLPNILSKFFFKLKVWTWIARQGQLLASADVIQIHDVFWWIWPLYPLIYFKTYLTFHGWEGRYPVQFKAKLQRYYNAMAAKKTLHVGDFIQHFYWDKPTAVIYGGAPSELIARLLKLENSDQLWLSNQSKIVFIGRLEAVNDLETTLTFLSLVKDKYPKIQISFVGDGSWRTECEKLGQVTGLVSDPSRFLFDCDLVCANSYLSILEAQALGKPVCAFYSNSLKEKYLRGYPGAKLMLIGNDPKAMMRRAESLTKKQISGLARKIKDFATTQTWQNVLNTYLQLWGMTNKN